MCYHGIGNAMHPLKSTCIHLSPSCAGVRIAISIAINYTPLSMAYYAYETYS